MILNRMLIIFLITSICVIVLTIGAIIVTWSIKCVLEWSDDIAYWYKEFKERHKHR